MGIRQDQLIARLKYIDACPDAIEWIRVEGIQTLAEAWKKCQNYDWMEWYIDVIEQRAKISKDKMRKYRKALSRLGHVEHRKRTLKCIRRYFPKPPTFRIR